MLAVHGTGTPLGDPIGENYSCLSLWHAGGVMKCLPICTDTICLSRPSGVSSGEMKVLLQRLEP